MDGSTIQQTTSDNTQAFLSDLTALSAKHGIAIGGTPTLYVMEREDYDYGYQADNSSTLQRG
jgi:hypothetical protein